MTAYQELNIANPNFAKELSANTESVEKWLTEESVSLGEPTTSVSLLNAFTKELNVSLGI